MNKLLIILLPLLLLSTMSHSSASGNPNSNADQRGFSTRMNTCFVGERANKTDPRQSAGSAFVCVPESASFPFADDGTIPIWLGAGPFEQPIIGFGQPGDEDAIGEAEVVPAEGCRERSIMAAADSVMWVPLSPSDGGFVDFHEAFSWTMPSAGPEKIWKAHAGYAFTAIHAPTEMDAKLLFGSNSRAKVLLNGEEVHRAWQDRNAVAGEDTVSVRLRAGENRLLIKVWQTHRNESIQFFAPLEWQWGFYSRIVDDAFRPVDGLTAHVELLDEPFTVDVTPTFFFIESEGALRQEVLVAVTNRSTAPKEAPLQLSVGGRTHRFDVSGLRPGRTIHSVFIPEIDAPGELAFSLDGGGHVLSREISVAPGPKFSLHLAMMSHTDIGYTNPQPIVVERHLETLDEVLEMCERDPEFRWTIETVWQLDHYERSRPAEKFEQLMKYVRAGCIAVSPVYSNPYTGWISEEEMLRSIDLANAYAERYGIAFSSAVYNDVPGFSQFLPRALDEADVTFLIAGINEVYNDYLLQRTKPKAFRWTGAGGSSVITYRTEAYNEGQTYGMVKGIEAMRYRMWNRLFTYRAQGHEADVILMNTTRGDNGGIPRIEYENALAWNERYAYPKIVVSTINDFADAFGTRYADTLPEITGDWTSTWDILFQGEPARMIRQRWAQHHLLAAEKLGAVSWLSHPRQEPLDELIADAYRSLLTFSGHGSGLEYGYGSPEENLVTMGFREQYVRDALFTTEAALQRGIYRLYRDEFSFDGEGVIVFNPHSWDVDSPVMADFPVERGQRFRVTDLGTGEVMPSFQEGHRLRFVARDVPSVGFRKYGIDPIEDAASGTGGTLDLSPVRIENAYYRVETDAAAGRINRIVDLRSGHDLISDRSPMPFALPVTAGSGDDGDFRPVTLSTTRTEMIDQRPARVALRIEYDHPVFTVARIDLWENVDRIDVTWEVNLEGLTPPESVEEYGIAFPFHIRGARPYVEVAGGFLPVRDGRFTSIDHDAYSIRRSVVLAGSDRSIQFASVDGRVVRLRETDDSDAPVLVANVVNNFPEHWNRYEENKGTLKYRFSFRTAGPGFDPSGAARFGWNSAMAPLARRTWFTVEPATKSFFTAPGDPVNLRSIRTFPERCTLLLTLVNEDPENPATTFVESSFLRDVVAYRSNARLDRVDRLHADDRGVRVSLGPGETVFVAMFPDGTSGPQGKKRIYQRCAFSATDH